MCDIILRVFQEKIIWTVSHVSGPNFEKVISQTHSWCEKSNINTANRFKMY